MDKNLVQSTNEIFSFYEKRTEMSIVSLEKRHYDAFNDNNFMQFGTVFQAR